MESNLNPFPNIIGFYGSAVQVFWKLWGKRLFDFSTFQLFDFCFFRSKSGKFSDNCQVKNFNISR